MPENMSAINRATIIGHNEEDGFDEIRVATSFADLYGGIQTARAVRILDDEAAYSPAKSWRFRHFGSLALEGDAAWDADPDGDGVPNILEYALGGDPHEPHTVPRAQPGWTEHGEETYFTFRINRNPDAHGIAFLVETSIDLEDWLNGSDHIVILDEEPDYIRVRSTTPLSSETIRFMRFGVSPPTP